MILLTTQEFLQSHSRPVVLSLLMIVPVLVGGCSVGQEETAAKDLADNNVVRVTGEIESANSAYFGPPVVPNIWQHTISFMAPEGRRVRAGMPILKFDAQAVMTRLRDKSNALNEKEKQLQKQEIVAREAIAEGKLKKEEAVADLAKARLKADIPIELLASREYREHKLTLKQAESQLALAKQMLVKEQRVQDTELDILQREIAVLNSEVAQHRASIDSMTIKAPGPGVVIYTVDRRNNKFEVGDNVWMGRRVMELPDLSQLQVHLEIPERESARIAVGQQVKFTLDAAPENQFVGEVIELASVIHTKSRNQPARVVDAIVGMKNPDQRMMRPGMSVSAEIQLRKGAL